MILLFWKGFKTEDEARGYEKDVRDLGFSLTTAFAPKELNRKGTYSELKRHHHAREANTRNWVVAVFD